MASMSLRPHARVLCALTGLATFASGSFGAGPASPDRIDTLDRSGPALAYVGAEHAMPTGAHGVTAVTDACTPGASGVALVALPTDIGEAPAAVRPFDLLPGAGVEAVWSGSDAVAFEESSIVSSELGSSPDALETVTLPASVATSLLALDNLSSIVATPN